MGLFVVGDVMLEVGFALMSRIFYAQLGTAVSNPGSATVNLVDRALYPGAQLLVGSGNTLEAISISSVTGTGFTATFAKAHPATDILQGATFPEGVGDSAPLFSTSELLKYFADIQNDFLLQTRCIYTTAAQTLKINQRYYANPSDAIRLERVSINGQGLYDTSQPSLDMEDPGWQNLTRPTTPSHWFQDETPGQAQYGFKPAPQVGNPALIWYSQRGSSTLGLDSTFLVPDPMVYILKYGVLAACWSKEGEQRDPIRAEYSKRRYAQGVGFARKFMEGIGATVKNYKTEAENLVPRLK